MGPEDLARALSALGTRDAADVLVGLESPDDAGVYAFDGEDALVATVDFFTPIVDDPHDFGAIAAANALSDIYAMGGRPLFALNVVAFPAELDRSILVEILRGGREKAEEAGVAIIGGHSIDDREPKYGMAVVGRVARDRIYRKSAGQAGDRLVLSKAIGTGVISTAIKQGLAPTSVVEGAISSMLRLNRRAFELGAEYEIRALTDVSGFGLLGHLSELARMSGLAAHVDAGSVPRLPGAADLARQGCLPGGTRRNREFVEPQTRWASALDEADRFLLCDAQTSGGLLMSVPPARASGLLDALVAEGHVAAEIGALVDGHPGAIEVR